MTNRLHPRADAKLRKRVSELLGPNEKPPSSTQLERWREEEYIPFVRSGRGPGSAVSYPPGTAEQVVALMRELQRKRDIGRAALRLFLAPENYWIGAKALRPAVIAELRRVRIDMEKAAKTWRGPGAAPADAERTAANLAAWIANGQVSAKLTRQRGFMLTRLQDPQRYTEGASKEERLELAFSGLFYAFLTGQPFPGIEYCVYVAFGGEELTKNLLPPGVTMRQADSQLQNAAPDDVVMQQLRLLSLPGLAKPLSAMKTEDFERARADTAVVVDLILFLWRAAGALLPRDVLDRLWVLSDDDWHFAIGVAALPILYSVRRRATARLDAVLEHVRTSLPGWRESLESGLQAGAFADDKKRKTLLADIFSKTTELLAEDS